MPDYDWTLDAGDAAFGPGRLARVIGISVAGCRNEEEMDAGRPLGAGGCAFWSVHFHQDDDEVEPIADRSSRTEAIDLAKTWAARLSVPVHVF